MTDITIQEVNTSLTLQVTSTDVSIVEEPKTSISILETPVNLEVLQDLIHEICIEEPSAVEFEYIEAGIIGPAGPEGPQGPQGVSGTTTQGEAAQAISALKIVRSINATQIVLADSTMSFTEARTLGMSITSAGIGGLVDVVFFGAVEDPSFTFPLNAPLFLTQNGNISDVQDPLSVYNSTIGYSLGAGTIFINLQEPIEL